ncbi:uncharacterized protein SAPINGB_P001797 [Magnusiomyces paraingens]|uniref:Uncharacterized protein n=1 Tax=Magnusiomyces paraingens TaxID=2606893 RepID=A0A5E8BCQ0_9ASCO|nr:uncharacterized protein SAPINGB_P001797 [Saprochaete ingens]VVT48474.1 unnamed protein product [Saprochaete ingens]
MNDLERKILRELGEILDTCERTNKNLQDTLNLVIEQRLNGGLRYAHLNGKNDDSLMAVMVQSRDALRRALDVLSPGGDEP